MSTPPTVTRSIRSSELSRNPASVFAAAEEGPVTITRRDGEALILSRASDVDKDREGLQLAAALVAASLSPGETPFSERLKGPFPWVDFLSATDRQAFAEEVVDVARACASVSRFEPLVLTLTSWHATAQAIASGYTPDHEQQWLEQPVTVPDPRD